MSESEHLSPHFTRAEFACHCGCGKSEAHPALIAALEELRKTVGPIRVISGLRCPEHNLEVGGQPYSQHVLGRAADIAVTGLTALSIYRRARKIVAFKGFGLNQDAHTLHVDVRDANVVVRWSYRKHQIVPWPAGIST